MYVLRTRLVDCFISAVSQNKESSFFTVAKSKIKNTFVNHMCLVIWSSERDAEAFWGYIECL